MKTPGKHFALAKRPLLRNRAMTRDNESADEVVVCPDQHAGWRIEVPDPDRPQGVFVTIVAERQEALDLAGRLYPNARIKVVDDSAAT